MLALSMAAPLAFGQTGPITDRPLRPPTAPDTMAAKMQADHATAQPTSLKIVVGEKSIEWTPAALAARPHTSFTVYNEHAKANQTYSGVPLIELLTPLGVPEKPHGKEFKLCLVAEGADGYKVVYSVAEVTPDVHDAQVIVADTLDGKPLADSGPLQLVATGEKRPARWVKNLTNIHVLTVE
jgi:hypothetical protein